MLIPRPRYNFIRGRNVSSSCVRPGGPRTRSRRVIVRGRNRRLAEVLSSCILQRDGPAWRRKSNTRNELHVPPLMFHEKQQAERLDAINAHFLQQNLWSQFVFYAILFESTFARREHLICLWVFHEKLSNWLENVYLGTICLDITYRRYFKKIREISIVVRIFFHKDWIKKYPSRSTIHIQREKI